MSVSARRNIFLMGRKWLAVDEDDLKMRGYEYQIRTHWKQLQREDTLVGKEKKLLSSRKTIT